MNITAKTKLCMVIGDPVEHSLSPQMHNAGYKALHIDDQYVYVACRVAVANIAAFIEGVRTMHIRGVSCTIPHKMEVMPYLDNIDPIAKKIGAVNTIVNDKDTLTGYNTDWLGILTPLEKVTSLQGKTVALLGAGGAARAAAYAVTSKDAYLTVYNRTIAKAEALATTFGVKAASLDNADAIGAADIIINTTAIGLHPQEKETPVPKAVIKKQHIVFDAVYGAGQTRLIREANEQGATTIEGKEMLLHQGLAQFTLFTGHATPEEAMRKELQ